MGHLYELSFVILKAVFKIRSKCKTHQSCKNSILSRLQIRVLKGAIYKIALAKNLPVELAHENGPSGGNAEAVFLGYPKYVMRISSHQPERARRRRGSLSANANGKATAVFERPWIRFDELVHV